MAMNEADTRANLIDPKLVDAGWGKVELSFIRREVNITQGRIIGSGKRTSPVVSDYVLEYNTISDAASELGPPTVIRETFIGFQQYLYSG